jgi:hypothetical protein
MRLEDLAPAAVAKLRGALGRACYVGEQDRGEHAVRRPGGPRPGHELA